MMGSVRCVTCLFLCAALGSNAIAAPAGAETLKEKLDREKAAMDSLHATLEQDREVLTRTELQKLSVGTQLDRLQQTAVRTKRELRGLAAKGRSLLTRVSQTREALAVAETGGVVYIKGETSELLLISQSVTLSALNGTVIIGKSVARNAAVAGQSGFVSRRHD